MTRIMSVLTYEALWRTSKDPFRLENKFTVKLNQVMITVSVENKFTVKLNQV
jgi:hypothetical protein